MAAEKTFKCSLLTPDRQVLECAARFVALPAHDGEMGFLRNRAPMVCKLGTGGLRVDSPEGDRRYFIDGGFAQMLENSLTVLTDWAQADKDVTIERAEGALREAIDLPADDADSRAKRESAVHRARARLRFARRFT